MRAYPFTVTFDGSPTRARLSDENDPAPGLYLDLPPGQGEVLVGIGCAEGLIRDLWGLVGRQAALLGAWRGVAEAEDLGAASGDALSAATDALSRLADLHDDLLAVLADEPLGRSASAHYEELRADAEKWRRWEQACRESFEAAEASWAARERG
jgi:hypothetical protein